MFISFDSNAPELSDVVGPLDWHFKDWHLEDRYIEYHVAKIIPCNWKVVAEAFMESQHAPTTHPQISTHVTDVNSQYDVFSDYVTRQISAGAEPSPLVDRANLSEQKIVDDMLSRRYKMYDDVAEVPRARPQERTWRRKCERICSRKMGMTTVIAPMLRC